MDLKQHTQCRLCSQKQLLQLIDFGMHPITKYLLEEKEQQVDIYPIVLLYCPYCSFVQLETCISSLILYGHQVNLSSWKNQPQIPYILDTIQNLPSINHQSKVLEIGCNDGSFLRELKRLGYKNLVGVDPGAPDSENGISYHQEGFYGQIEEYFDLVIARHTLEHIEQLEWFGYNLKNTCKEGTFLLIEVPDFEWFMYYKDYSAIWEEHVNYFTEVTLKKYLLQFGIEVLRTTRFQYSGQALFAVCMYTGEIKSPGQHSENRIREYKNSWINFKSKFREALKKRKKDVVVYGAGCRSTSLINYTEVGDLISLVVDDQEEKQNKFLPGSKLPIYPPYQLYNGQIDTCLLAINAENEESVLKKHTDFHGEFYSILPPSRRMLSI